MDAFSSGAADSPKPGPVGTVERGGGTDPDSAQPILQQRQDGLGWNGRVRHWFGRARLDSEEAQRGADPKPASVIGRQAVDPCRGHRAAAGMGPQLESEPVVADQAPAGAEPEVAVGSLGQRIDLGFRQPVVPVNNSVKIGLERAGLTEKSGRWAGADKRKSNENNRLQSVAARSQRVILGQVFTLLRGQKPLG